MPILAIDFEASCLPKHGRSFPIEVGIADGAGYSRSWLIRPHPDWSDWGWTAEAEALHCLSRVHIERDGTSADQVLRELVRAVGAHSLIADSHLDDGWFRTLCAAAGSPPPFKVHHIDELAEQAGATAHDIRNAVAHADRVFQARHRARSDALWVAAVADRLCAGTVTMADRPLFRWGAPLRGGKTGFDPSLDRLDSCSGDRSCMDALTGGGSGGRRA